MNYIFLILGIIVIFAYLNPTIVSDMIHPKQTPIQPTTTSLSIASWNLRNFGPDKGGNTQLLETYVEVLDNFDIVIIQEILDESQTAFPRLCSLMPDYDCLISVRKGRPDSTRREQYGLVYKSAIVTNVTESMDYEKWERPPTAFQVFAMNTSYTLITLHSKPEDTPQELDYLDDYAATFTGNVIVLGDMNMDGDYYKGIPPVFVNWTYAIPNGCDSTVAESRNCYDRIFLNFGSGQSGTYTAITPEQSDHYPVWVRLT